MPRPIHARIERAALQHNYRLAKRLAPQAQAWAVVKANAYGHGIAFAAEALGGEADGFALLDLAEAVALREAGIRQPILLLEGFFTDDDLELVLTHDLTPVIHRADQLATLARRLQARADPQAPAQAVYLKVNTGMNRLGLDPAELPALLAQIAAQPCFAPATLMTHFAEADGGRGIDWQLARWQALQQQLLGVPAVGKGPCSLANSAALLRYPATHADWVRPGIMLYGGSPFAETSAAALGLRPVMSLCSEIIGVQTVPAGERVGYAGLFVAERPTRVGIVACGYADGYPRHAPGGTPLLVDGQRSTTLGRVSMDMLACDLTHLPAAGIGSPVTLWGEGLPADAVASAAGTISYELFCALARRVPVRVV